MYKLFELYGTKWVEVLDRPTLEELKGALIEESKWEEIDKFRIDEDEAPLMFCGTSELEIKYCIENIDKIESAAMYLHNAYEKRYQRVVVSKPSKQKKNFDKPKKPKKTTKKHLKKLARTVKRRRSYY